MELYKSPVVFNPEEHTYTLGTKQLRGITGMIKSQLFPDEYKDVPAHILANAAERGSFVHSSIELVDDLGVEPETEEAKNYIALKEKHSLQVLCSEYLVSDEADFASMIDKVFRLSDTEVCIGDIKTTYALNEEYVRWQLSIYAHLFERQNPGITVKALYAIWLRGPIHKLIELERIPTEQVKELMRCELSNERFLTDIVPASHNLPRQVKDVENYLYEMETRMKKWEEERDKILSGILKLMDDNNVDKWIGEKVSFTRRKQTSRESLDGKALKEKYPDIARKFTKISTVKSSITIKTL
jgi:hypothetical protein